MLLLRLVALACLAAAAYAVVRPDCAQLEDGHYVVGCNRVFYRCYQKGRYEHTCPGEEMFFDPQRAKCMDKDEVKQCKNSRRYDGEVIKAKEFSCKGKKTGDYAHPGIPCDKYYYSCNHGVTYQMLCPPQQYFDSRSKSCDLKKNVPACLARHRVSGYLDDPLQDDSDSAQMPGHATIQPLPPAPNTGTYQLSSFSNDGPVAPPGSNAMQEETPQTSSSTPDCSSRGDGVFEDPSSKCTTFFWKCAHNRLFKYHCPNGLFYDVEFNRCIFKQDIPNCGGVRPTPVTTTTQTQPAFDQSIIDFDCSNKTDGFYSVGHCKPVFVSCTGGHGRPIPCSKELYYDERINACDYEDRCSGVREPEQPIVPVKAHGQIDADIPSEPKVNFDCLGKSDGFYSLGDCHAQYIQCSNGYTSVTKCPAGLAYNANANSCDYPHKCKQALVQSTISTSIEQSQSQPRDQQPTTQSPPSTRTSRYGDGAVVITSTTTPASPTTPTPAADEPSTTTITNSGYELPPFVPSRTTQPPQPQRDQGTGAGFCSTKPNGAYAKVTCSQEYVSCWDGMETSGKCNSDLIFNPYNGQCDYQLNVVDCNSGESRDEPQTTTTLPLPSQPIQPFCEMLADGYYAAGCSNAYYLCTNQYTRRLNCPQGLVFDVRKNLCDRPSNVVACVSAAPAKTMPTSTYHKTMTSTPAEDTPVTTTPSEQTSSTPTAYKSPKLDQPTFDCTARPDGIYAFPICTRYYAQCYQQQSMVQACAEGLWYSEQSGLCDYKERVPVCNENSPTATASQDQPSILPTATVSGPTSASAYGYQTQTNSQQQQVNFQQSAAGFSCTGKLDGYYSAGCSSTYYSCISEVTHKMTCPGDLKFAAAQEHCEDSEHVVECGGQPRPTAPAQDQPTSTSLPLFSCSGAKVNGMFEIEKCHRDYAICEHGVYHLGRCLPMLVFNPTTLTCDFKQNTPTCGSMYVPTAAPTLVPVQHTAPIGSSDCINKADGFYALGGCVPNYLQCLKQVAYYGACPSTLRFNPTTGRCEFVANIAGCSIVPTTSGEQQQPQQSQPEPVPSRPNSTSGQQTVYA